MKPWPRTVEGVASVGPYGSSDVFAPSQDRASVPQLPVRGSENGSEHARVEVCLHSVCFFVALHNQKKF